EVTPQNMVRLFLLTAEADRLGVAVNDDDVNDLINTLTGDRLTKEGFDEARRGVGVPVNDIYGALRREIRARRAATALQPRYAPTPDALWALHKRANVRQSLETVSFPVAAFVGDVEAPSEAELVAFFNEYKNFLPEQRGPGEPGFRTPRQVQLAYVEADFIDALAEVPEPSAAEIEAFYEANKDVRYIDRSTPDDDAADAPGDDGPQVDAPALGPPAATEPAAEAPAETDEPAENTAPATEEPAPTEEPAAVEEPAPAESEPTPSESPAEEPPAEPEAPTPAEPTPAEPAPAEPAPGETSDLGRTPVVAFAQVTDDAAATDATEDEPAPEADAIPVDFTNIYLPLDDDLRTEIADELRRLRAFDVVREKTEAARAAMGRLVLDAFGTINAGELQSDDPAVKAKAREAYREAVRTATDGLRAYAAANRLSYESTPLLSFQDLITGETYPIGRAVDPSSGSFGGRRRTTAEVAFGDLGLSTPTTEVVEEPGGGTRYAYWKIDDREASIPELDAEGLRERVVAAWKSREALPKAEERAAAFLEGVAEGTSLRDAVAGDAPPTVTGADGSDPLAVSTTPPFSWLRRGSAASPFGFAIPTLEPGDVPGIGALPDETMAELFDTLNVGGVTTLTAPDKSAVYVVRVRDRTARTESDQIALKQDFIGSGVFRFTSPYASAITRTRNDVAQEWLLSLEDRYEVRSADPTLVSN
ncbi:MAG: hypothetical protein AAGJ97_07945, partial [Planctomycetota bacterium]